MLAKRRDVAPVEHDATVGRLVQTQDRPPDGRLATAGLADEPDGLAAADRERDVVDRSDVTDVAVEHESALDREVDLQVLELDERPGAVHHAVAAARVRSHSSIGTGLKQATWCPASSSTSCGTCWRDKSTSYRQRGWNGHAVGARSMLGGAPSIGCRRARRAASSRGTLWSSPSVYGWRGAPNSCSADPVSMNMPAYITLTRSHIPATTPRSCVIRISAAFSSATSARIRSRICAWMVTSSAVVGSSAISSFGLHASAIAIIARWRMPPEN